MANVGTENSIIYGIKVKKYVSEHVSQRQPSYWRKFTVTYYIMSIFNATPVLRDDTAHTKVGVPNFESTLFHFPLGYRSCNTVCTCNTNTRL